MNVPSRCPSHTERDDTCLSCVAVSNSLYVRSMLLRHVARQPDQAQLEELRLRYALRGPEDRRDENDWLTDVSGGEVTRTRYASPMEQMDAIVRRCEGTVD